MRAYRWEYLLFVLLHRLFTALIQAMNLIILETVVDRSTAVSRIIRINRV